MCVFVCTRARACVCVQIIDNLRTLDMVRVRCREVFALVEEGKGRHFSLHKDNIPACVELVKTTILVRTVPQRAWSRGVSGARVLARRSTWTSTV